MNSDSDPEGRVVTGTLARPDVHEAWEAVYRTAENERFYERAFDALLAEVPAPPGTKWADIGCGPGFHAMRLARRGYPVHAVDVSEAILTAARENVARARLADRVSFAVEDMTSLSFESDSYSRLLCWGVLMHVPRVGLAIGELVRVLAPGGTLVVSEGNLRSLDALALALAERISPSRRRARRTAAGLERWKETEAGPLLTRQANVQWLTEAFAGHGLQLTARRPAQFTELYTRTAGRSATATKALHRLNDLWLTEVRSGALASGNILIFHKPVRR